MKKNLLILASLSIWLCTLFTACSDQVSENGSSDSTTEHAATSATSAASNIGDSNDTFGEDLSDLQAYDGYFEEDIVDVTVTCVSGTPDCYTLDGNVLTFTAVSEDSVYAISGQLKGSIVIDTGDAYKFDLEMQGLSLVSDTINPITVLSGAEVSLTAKAETVNYIYDTRTAVESDDTELYTAAVYSKADLEVCGKGQLTLVSEHNNGIHSKDDLQVKNLTLLVACMDNALKGNDSVEIESGTTTLIAAQGDGIKTANSDISDKGNQRGTISVLGGTHTVYAACDGLDAAYDVVIDNADTQLTVYTDKYSNYSTEVTAVSDDVYYIRFTDNNYRYSVKYYNAEDDYVWVNASYHSGVSGGRDTYYYYSFAKMTNYAQMQVFMYSSNMEQGQDQDYVVASDLMTPSSGYDTFALTSRGNNLQYSWTNYTTTVQDGMGGMGGMGGHGGMGGMQEGNSDKGDYSTKGIKASNAITVNDGTITVKSYDDAFHANADAALENGEASTGDINLCGGTITAYSNDDGIHADGTLTVSGGTVYVTDSYEGLEGMVVTISGGYVSVIASDDGVNSTATTGEGFRIDDGALYVYAGGDGIDTNSRTSYSGIVFAGGQTVVISTSSGNSAIDTEQGYRYDGGRVLALMPSGGMSNEAVHCSNFSSIGTRASASLNANGCLTVAVSGKEVVTLQSPTRLNAMVIYLGAKNATVTTDNTTTATLNSDGVCWY